MIEGAAFGAGGGNIIDHLIIVLLLPLFFSVGYFVDRYRNAQAELEKALGRETYISNSLQAVFYPQVRQIEGYQFAARYRSVLEESELGGDNYDVFSLGDNKTALAIADVSSKGLRAAILGAFLKSVLRAYLHESLDLSGTVVRYRIHRGAGRALRHDSLRECRAREIACQCRVSGRGRAYR